MTVKLLYRYTREDGGISVSPTEPKQEHSVLYRIIADEGMSLVRDGQTFGSVTDTKFQDGWSEIETPRWEEI